MATDKMFDEFSPGEFFDSFARTITETDLVNYLNMTMLREPMFLDEEFCKEHSIFGTRICPGLMTAAFSSAMLDDILGRHVLAAIALDRFTFTVPVTPGDTLHCRVTVEEKRETSKPDRGVMIVRTTVRNQRDETPLEYWATILMRRTHL